MLRRTRNDKRRRDENRNRIRDVIEIQPALLRPNRPVLGIFLQESKKALVVLEKCRDRKGAGYNSEHGVVLHRRTVPEAVDECDGQEHGIGDEEGPCYYDAAFVVTGRIGELGEGTWI